MIATLVKERGYYDLYRIDENGKKVIFASTEDYKQKLSKQNCDEIFGVFDVQKLAKEVLPNDDTTGTLSKQKGFVIGFNKAMELNKDKVFTLEDMQECWRASAYYSTNQSRINYESFIQSIQQPTEIEVEIEMEVADLAFYENGERYPIEANIPERFKYKPKLDSNGCLILKRVV